MGRRVMQRPFYCCWGERKVAPLQCMWNQSLYNPFLGKSSSGLPL